MEFKNFTTSNTLMGKVLEVRARDSMFVLETRSKDRFDVFIGSETYYEVIRYLGSFSRDRVGKPKDATQQQRLEAYIKKPSERDRPLPEGVTPEPPGAGRKRCRSAPPCRLQTSDRSRT